MNTYKHKHVFEEPISSLIGSAWYTYNKTTTFVSYSPLAYTNVLLNRSFKSNQIKSFFYFLKLDLLDLLEDQTANKKSLYSSLSFGLK